MDNSTLALLTGNTLLDSTFIGEITFGNLFAALIIIIATYIVGKFLSILVLRILAGKVDPNNSTFLVKLVKWVIYFIGFLIASPFLHVDLSGLMVAGGVVAVALGFASQNTLSNFVAGVLLMFERPVALGDNISVNGTEGYVQEIGLLSTTIRTYEGIFVRIPNDSMFSSDITNYVAHIARRFDYDIGISYSEDADKAMGIIREVIDKHPYALRSPAPTIYVNLLDASSVNLKVRIWAPSGYWWDVRTDLLWKIFKALRTAGVDIPFQQVTLWFGDDAAKIKQLTKGTGFSPNEVLGKSIPSPENANKAVK
jgi:2,3-bisphosphoglycerate-dependent phosphoglycerate mutase